MPRRWRKPFRNFVAVCLVILIGQSLVPAGAVAVAGQAVAQQAVAQRVVAPASITAQSHTVQSHTVQSQRSELNLLTPNLIVLKAADLYIQRTSLGRYLRFESGLGNIGRGPIEVRPNNNQSCPEGKRHATQIIYRDVDGSRFYRRDVDTEFARRSAGCMVFHIAHDHWHFQAASRYTLFQPGEDRSLVRVVQRKMSFCLRDSRRLPSRYGGASNRPQFYGGCSKYSPQGISTGWADIYQSFLAGQAVRLPASAGKGLYCLQIKVDPKNLLVESDDEDNTSMRAFTLKGDNVTFQPTARCT